MLAVGLLGALDLGAVRDGEEVRLDHEGDGEDGLEVGFVPAGEGAAAVGGLHLAGGDDLFVPVGIAERAAIPAAQFVVQRSRELDGERRCTGGEGVVDDQPLGGGVEVMAVDRRAVHRHRDDAELVGVQDQPIDRFRHVEGDVGPSTEGCGRQIGLEHQVVAGGNHGAGQAVRIVGHGVRGYRCESLREATG